MNKTFKVNKANGRKVTITSWLYRRLCPYRVSEQTSWPQDTATYKGPSAKEIQSHNGNILFAQVLYFTVVSRFPSSLHKDNTHLIHKKNT